MVKHSSKGWAWLIMIRQRLMLCNHLFFDLAFFEAILSIPGPAAVARIGNSSWTLQFQKRIKEGIPQTELNKFDEFTLDKSGKHGSCREYFLRSIQEYTNNSRNLQLASGCQGSDPLWQKYAMPFLEILKPLCQTVGQYYFPFGHYVWRFCGSR